MDGGLRQEKMGARVFRGVLNADDTQLAYIAFGSGYSGLSPVGVGWKYRDGMVFNTPAGAIHGPKVMLIDQNAGSGGDFLPYSFQVPPYPTELDQ